MCWVRSIHTRTHIHIRTYPFHLGGIEKLLDILSDLGSTSKSLEHGLAHTPPFCPLFPNIQLQKQVEVGMD